MPPPDDDEMFDQPAHQKAFPTPPSLRKGFQEICSRVYDSDADVIAEYEVIEKSLSVDEALTPGALRFAANHTEAMAHRAFKLFLVAQFEYEAYVRLTDGIVGALHEAAVTHLEKEKRTMVEDGKGGKPVPLRSKNITDKDTTAAMAELYPDEWHEVMNRRTQAGGMLAVVKNLADLAKSRCTTVRKILDSGGDA